MTADNQAAHHCLPPMALKGSYPIKYSQTSIVQECNVPCITYALQCSAAYHISSTDNSYQSRKPLSQNQKLGKHFHETNIRLDFFHLAESKEIKSFVRIKSRAYGSILARILSLGYFQRLGIRVKYVYSNYIHIF